MSDISKKRPRSRRKIIILFTVIVGCTLAIVAVLLFYQKSQSNNKTYTNYPLGNQSKLKYVDEEKYGCWLICDSSPASTYYYETNMSAQEVAKYFKKAKLYRPIENDLDSTRIWLIKDNQDFILSYYKDKKKAQQEGFDITAKYLVSIPNFNYEKAKGSL